MTGELDKFALFSGLFGGLALFLFGMDLMTAALKRVAGDKLKDLRIEKGYSSYENFAVDNDLGRMQYWRLENGKTNLTIKATFYKGYSSSFIV